MSKQHRRRKDTRPPKDTVVRGIEGAPCPRCGWPMQVREHRRIRPRHLRQPFYYTRWYFCTTNECATTLVMPEAFKVLRGATPPNPPAQGQLDLGDDIVMAVLDGRA